MTIQSAFNEITETLGGTPSTDGTITGAIDALNDTLAGENQERGNSIEDAVRLLGEHIGGNTVGNTVGIKDDMMTLDLTWGEINEIRGPEVSPRPVLLYGELGGDMTFGVLTEINGDPEYDVSFMSSIIEENANATTIRFNSISGPDEYPTLAD